MKKQHKQLSNTTNENELKRSKYAFFMKILAYWRFWCFFRMTSAWRHGGYWYGQVTWQLTGRWHGTGHGGRVGTWRDEVAVTWSNGGDAEVTSQGGGADVTGGKRYLVSSRTTFKHRQYWERGLRTHREGDTWWGYGRETTHPPDVNLRQIGGWKRPPNIDQQHVRSEGWRRRWSDEGLRTGPARHLNNNAPAGSETLGSRSLWVFECGLELI